MRQTTHIAIEHIVVSSKRSYGSGQVVLPFSAGLSRDNFFLSPGNPAGSFNTLSVIRCSRSR